VSRGPHLVLVGMMGAGKTTAGTLAAAALDRPFLDSDAEVEARTGRTVREIFAADGEDAFRAVESEVLRDTLATTEPAVVAAAGGTVLDPANRRRLRDAGTVVWLRAEPAVLAGRAATGGHRPLLDDDPVGVLDRLAVERDGLYREVSDVVVDTGVGPLAAVVDALVAAARAAEQAGATP
jgi:shikimate kinase